MWQTRANNGKDTNIQNLFVQNETLKNIEIVGDKIPLTMEDIDRLKNSVFAAFSDQRCL